MKELAVSCPADSLYSSLYASVPLQRKPSLQQSQRHVFLAKYGPSKRCPKRKQRAAENRVESDKRE